MKTIYPMLVVVFLAGAFASGTLFMAFYPSGANTVVQKQTARASSSSATAVKICAENARCSCWWKWPGVVLMLVVGGFAFYKLFEYTMVHYLFSKQ